MDKLLEEFLDYQLLEDSDIPISVWNEATVVEDNNNKYYRMDVLWQHLSVMKDPDGSFCFERLSAVAKLVLVIPHSYAEEEHVFSMVRKNKTAFRPSLDPKGTLSSILTIKLATIQPSHEYEPTSDLLSTAKSATWEYNKTHTKK